jgi:hypothetical protein
MASYLRKCVSPGAPLPTEMNHEYSLLWFPDGTYRNLRYHANTLTPWTRLFVSWRWLMPYEQTADPSADHRNYESMSFPTGEHYTYHATGTSPADYAAAIDGQIAQARNNPYLNLKVILVFWEFPRWANDTADKTDAFNPNGDRTTQNGNKAHEWRIPSDVGATSPWRSALEWLIERYRDQVYFFEIMNEPNLQWWPQRSADGATPTASCTAAQMFQTAQTVQQAVQQRHPNPPTTVHLMGPATADNLIGATDSRSRTSYQTFMGPTGSGNDLLTQLSSLNFQPGPNFAWTHHNYTDVEYDIGDKSQNGYLAGQTNARNVREKLKTRWRGWPYEDAANPYVCLTEGGAQIDKLKKLYTAPPDDPDLLKKQANLLLRNWKRMKGDADPGYSDVDSFGIGMITQYLWHTDLAFFDSGICNPLPDTGPRPAFQTWADCKPAY